MTSTVDIDSKLDKILIRARINNNTPRQVYIDDVKALIREVVKEVIGEYEDSGKIEWHGEEDARIAGRDDLRSEQRTKLNKILGEK